MRAAIRLCRRRLLISFTLGVAALSGCADAVGPPQIRCDTPGSVTVGGEGVPAAPGGFVTAGNQIFSATSCTPQRFVGVSHPAFTFSPDGGRLGVETTAAADFAMIRTWGANTVKLELAQHFWVPTSRFYDPQYAARVQRAVVAARGAGLYVILALLGSDRGDPNYPGDPIRTNMHQPMPDVNHSIPFWRDVASRYRGDGGILFELYTEPFPLGGAGGFSNWELWRNGGPHPADDVYEPRAPFMAAGMQQLYEAVRGAGANNLVIVSGTQWGYDLSGVPRYRLNGYNIAYSTHPWSWEGQRQPSDWDRAWVFLASTEPVMITEFGNYDCTESYPRAVLDRADKLGLSWISWAWMAPSPGSTKEQDSAEDPICSFPMLLTDWAGTPSRLGQLVRGRLSQY